MIIKHCYNILLFYKEGMWQYNIFDVLHDRMLYEGGQRYHYSWETQIAAKRKLCSIIMGENHVRTGDKDI